MTTSKKDYGVAFVNIELRYKAEMYFEKPSDIPTTEALLAWSEDMCRNFYRVGLSFSDRSDSYTASFTYKGGKSTDTPPCVTQHGRSIRTALLKQYVIFEVCQGDREGFQVARDVIALIEDRIEVALERLSQ